MKSLPTLLQEADEGFDEILPPPKSENEYVSEHMAIRSLTEDTPLTATELQMLVNSHQLLAKKHRQLKSHFRETVLSILAEAERATEGLQGQRLKYINEDKQLNTEFDIALNAVKSLWREFRGNLK